MAFNDLVDKSLKALLSSSAFGSDFTFRPQSGTTQTLKGIYSNDFEEVDLDGHVMIDSNTPNLGVNLNDFSVKPSQGDTIIIDSSEFTIASVQEDGHGAATIFLHRA
jgi:hypothetical protein